MKSAQDEFDRGSAFLKAGKPKKARDAFQRVIDSGDPDLAERGRVELGFVLRKHGKPGEACAAFEQAIRSRHSDWAPCAANNLGCMLLEQSDTAGAADAFGIAIQSGHRDYAPAAAINLGVTLNGAGDAAGACAAFQRAIDFAHPEHSPHAHYELAELLKRGGDVGGAAGAYQRAVDSGNANWAPLAANNLGFMLMQSGDLTGAREAYQRAIDSGHPQHAATATKNLRELDTPGFDPTRVVATQAREKATWVLRQGERVLIDSSIITPRSNNRTVQVTITDQRIRLAGFAFEYGDVTSVSHRTWRPETSGVVKVKYPGRRSFKLVSKSGVSASMEFGDDYDDNVAVWAQLVAVANQAIQPRLEREEQVRSNQRHAAHQAALQQTLEDITSRLRSGDMYSVDLHGGALTRGKVRKEDASLELSREGCLAMVGTRRADVVPWSAEPRAEWKKDGRLTAKCSIEISAISAKGERRKCTSLPVAFQHGDTRELVAALLHRCHTEFGSQATPHDAQLP